MKILIMISGSPLMFQKKKTVVTLNLPKVSWKKSVGGICRTKKFLGFIII